MSACIPCITAKNGPSLLLTEKGLQFLESFLQCQLCKVVRLSCTGSKLALLLSHLSVANNLLKAGGLLDQLGVEPCAETADHTLQETKVFLPCCHGMASKSSVICG